MKIKHEHIRQVIDAWLLYPNVGREKVADAIATAYFELGLTYPPMHETGTTEGLDSNIQNIFRWLKKDTPDAVNKVQALIPAILAILPRDLRNYLSIYDTAGRRAMLAAQDALCVAIDAHDDAVQNVYLQAHSCWGDSAGGAMH